MPVSSVAYRASPNYCHLFDDDYIGERTVTEDFMYRRSRRLKVWERRAFSEISRELAESDPLFRSPPPANTVNQGRLTGGRETPDGPLARSLALLVIGLILLVLGAVATSVLVLMLGVVCCIVGLCVSVAMTPRGPGRPG